MKLSTKISAAAVGLLLLLSQIFSIWNLYKTKEQILNNTVQFEWKELEKDAREFEEKYKSKENYITGERAQKYWARVSFQGNLGIDSVLYYKKQELINNTPYVFDVIDQIKQKTGEAALEAQKYGMDADRCSRTFLEEIGETHLLILYQEINETFQMLRSRDISDIYRESREIFLQGMAAAFLLAFLLLVVLAIAVKRILRPFYGLRDAANRIAAGDYGGRIEKYGNDEVGEVAQSFNCMAQCVQDHVSRMEETNEKQRRLLGALSHELKTPMTGIQGYAELLQKVELSPERQAKALNYIEEECKRLSRLSVKMLQIVELSGEEQIEKEPLSVRELFEQAEEITRHRLKKKHISLQIEAGEEMIEGDRDMLLSFLTNLIDNARKAGSEGSTICLIAKEDGLFVQDEGRGIPKEDAARIVEPFYMVDKSRARKEGGAGLGLALCSQIARLHGARLQIESRMGEGSCIGMRWETDVR